MRERRRSRWLSPALPERFIFFYLPRALSGAGCGARGSFAGAICATATITAPYHLYTRGPRRRRPATILTPFLARARAQPGDSAVIAPQETQLRALSLAYILRGPSFLIKKREPTVRDISILKELLGPRYNAPISPARPRPRPRARSCFISLLRKCWAHTEQSACNEELAARPTPADNARHRTIRPRAYLRPVRERFLH